MPRIELPNDAWAELVDKDSITRKQAKTYRRVLYQMGSDALAAKESAEGMDLGALDDMGDALVRTVVTSWSFGVIDPETFDDLPEAVFKAITAYCKENGYTDILDPDLDVNPDEGSPTSL